jgi:hypothetical protein
MSTFGPTITRGPVEDHKGTVIFLHGVAEAGIKVSKLAATLNLPHLKVCGRKRLSTSSYCAFLHFVNVRVKLLRCSDML